MSIKDLAQKRAELYQQSRALLERAKAEDRALNSEEESTFEKLDSEIETLGNQIEGLKKAADRQAKLDNLAAELEKPLPRLTSASLSEAAPRTFQFGKHEIQATGKLAALATDSYRDAFRSFLLGERRDYQSLGLIVGDDSKGGYTAPMEFSRLLIKFVDDFTFVRGLATVLPPTTAKSIGVLSYDTDPGDSDWTPEVPASDIAEDDNIRFGRREMAPHMLTKLLKSSRQLIRATSFPLETFLAQRLAYKFAITEEKAFLTGNGVQRPLGLFTASADGIPTSRDVTASANNAFTADNLINLFYSLKIQYQQRASWLMHRDVVAYIRKFKVASTTGGNDLQYLWQPGLDGAPDTILGRPVYVSEYAPNTFTTGQYLVMCGDFAQYYIQDGLTLEIQRLDELFSLRNQVGWKASKSVDGQPGLGEAFARLKLA